MTSTVTVTRPSGSSDGLGGQTLSWATQSPTIGFRTTQLGQQERAVAERLGLVTPAVVVVPHDSTVAVRDRLTIEGHTFDVVGASADTEPVYRSLLCIEVAA